MRQAMQALYLAVLATALLPGPARGQANPAASLQEILAGRRYPLSLKLSGLSSDWRRVNAGGQFDMPALSQLFGAMFGGGGAFYTRGETITVAGETYLVGYRPQVKGLDLAALMQSGAGAGPPTPEKLTPDTPLALSLLNLRTAGSLNDIRPFSLEQELAESGQGPGGLFGVFSEARERAQAASSESNLKQLGVALMMYTQDYDECYPLAKNAPSLKDQLMPYVKNEAVFVQPGSEEPYQPNPALAGKSMAQLREPARTPAVFEASAAEDGTRAVAFADGHASRIPEEEYQSLLAASKVELAPFRPKKPATRPKPRAPTRRPAPRRR